MCFLCLLKIYGFWYVCTFMYILVHCTLTNDNLFRSNNNFLWMCFLQEQSRSRKFCLSLCYKNVGSFLHHHFAYRLHLLYGICVKIASITMSYDAFPCTEFLPFLYFVNTRYNVVWKRLPFFMNQWSIKHTP